MKKSSNGIPVTQPVGNYVPNRKARRAALKTTRIPFKEYKSKQREERALESEIDKVAKEVDESAEETSKTA